MKYKISGNTMSLKNETGKEMIVKRVSGNSEELWGEWNLPEEKVVEDSRIILAFY